MLAASNSAPVDAAEAGYDPLPVDSALRILRFNPIPASSDIEVIHRDIKIGEDRVSDIQAKIYEMGGLLQRLNLAQQHLLAYIDLQQKTFANIRRLPDEILRNIFSFCADPLALALAKHPVWRLAQVCGRWRDIIIDSPSLWSAINVDQLSLGRHPKRIEHACKLLQLYFARSKTHPLTIRCFRFRKLDPAIAEILVSSSERWQDLFIYGYNGCNDRSLDGIKGRIPQLRRLHTHQCTFSSEVNLFETAPSLTSLKLDEISFEQPDTFPAFPYSQLTHVTLKTPMTFSAFRELSQSMTQAYFLDISLLLIVDDIEDGRLILPTVRELAIGSHPQPEILPYLDVPHLDRVCLYLGNSTDEADILEIKQFLQHPSFHASTFNLLGTPNLETALSILKAAPGIQNLHLGMEEDLIRDPIICSLTSGLIPNLSTLTLERVWRFDLGPITELLESKIGVSRLKFMYTLGLEDEYSWELEDLCSFAKERGVELDVGWTYVLEDSH